MDEPSLLLRLFSREALDPGSAATQLSFLFDFADRIFHPDECGSYEPFEPFDERDFARYVSWLAAPGGEFGFRRSSGPLPVEGYLTNLQPPEILVRVEGSPESRLLPSVSPSPFRLRWSLQIGWKYPPASAGSLVERLLLEACHITAADFGFVALNSDYRKKHFTSFRSGGSQTELYIGDDPAQGIPGLYWMNAFGPLYAEWFGEERLEAASAYALTTALPDGSVYLRFGDANDPDAGPNVDERERRVMQILAERAFFEIGRPDRVLELPPGLRRGRRKP